MLKSLVKSRFQSYQTASAYAVDKVVRRSEKALRSAASNRPPYVQMRQNRYNLSICSSPPISMLSANMADKSPRHVRNIPTSLSRKRGLECRM